MNPAARHFWSSNSPGRTWTCVHCGAELESYAAPYSYFRSEHELVFPFPPDGEVFDRTATWVASSLDSLCPRTVAAVLES